MKKMKRYKSLIAPAVLLVSLFIWLGADVPDLQNFPAGFHPFQKQQIHLSKEEIARIEEGRAVLKLLDTRAKSEFAVLGIVRIDVPQEYFLNRYRDIASFEKGTSMPQIGIFSTPPKLEDLKSLNLNEKDIKEIRGCKARSCGVRLSVEATQRIQKEVDWSNPRYQVQVNHIFRQMILQLVHDYMEIGNKALGPLQDRKKFPLAAEEFRTLLKASPYLKEYIPELQQYLQDYPKAKLLQAEDFFYWSMVEFGYKPTLRVNHVTIYKRAMEHGTLVAIASKQLYASHYFRSALELRFLVPLKNSKNGFHLLLVNRSRVDGLDGIFAGIKRAFIGKKIVKSLTSYLDNRKHTLEEQYSTDVSK
jgi:hypothetical protein